MASGYEKSPDYGGPDPTWRFWLFAVAVAVVTVWSVVGAFAAAYRGTAGRVVDGDTLWVCDRGVCTKIRLCGIDAPERGQRGYQEATAALSRLVNGKIVRCVQVGGGTPCDGHSRPVNGDRIVAQCYAGSTDVAAELVRAGFACDWRRFSGGYYATPGGCSR